MTETQGTQIVNSSKSEYWIDDLDRAVRRIVMDHDVDAVPLIETLACSEDQQVRLVAALALHTFSAATSQAGELDHRAIRIIDELSDDTSADVSECASGVLPLRALLLADYGSSAGG